jgi:hypothetical protein
MSDLSIRQALEARLDAMAPPLATAYENSDFTPVGGTPYQRVHLMPAEPDNPTMDSFRRLQGFFQVTLFYPQSAGSADVMARAEAVRAQFPHKLSLVKDGVTVQIDGTPYIMAGFADGDRWAVPVRIPYFANLS